MVTKFIDRLVAKKKCDEKSSADANNNAVKTIEGDDLKKKKSYRV
jgi:hypothetical protein